MATFSSIPFTSQKLSYNKIKQRCWSKETVWLFDLKSCYTMWVGKEDGIFRKQRLSRKKSDSKWMSVFFVLFQYGNLNLRLLGLQINSYRECRNLSHRPCWRLEILSPVFDTAVLIFVLALGNSLAKGK